MRKTINALTLCVICASFPTLSESKENEKFLNEDNFNLFTVGYMNLICSYYERYTNNLDSGIYPDVMFMNNYVKISTHLLKPSDMSNRKFKIILESNNKETQNGVIEELNNKPDMKSKKLLTKMLINKNEIQKRTVNFSGGCMDLIPFTKRYTDLL